MAYADLATGASSAIQAALSGAAEGIAVATSGSTARPRLVNISRSALLASCEAAHERLGGTGTWLLALPDDRIGGANVLARSAVARTEPVAMPAGPFTADAFASAAEALLAREGRRYASLVPTQVARIMADARAAQLLAQLDAVLVGGAALRGVEAPANAIVSYGMTETCGGCVFDGEPLDGVEVAIDGDGHVLIAGAVLADGYADGDDSSFASFARRRWFRTPDLGEDRGGLRILGRADDAILTGGHTVHPATVVAAVVALPEVAEAAVVGVPDAEWGARVVVIATAAGTARPGVEEIRDALGDALPRYALPRAVTWVDSLPMLATGKIDRIAARDIAGAEGDTDGIGE